MNKIYLNIKIIWKINNLEKLTTFWEMKDRLFLGENIQFDRSGEQHLEVTLKLSLGCKKIVTQLQKQKTKGQETLSALKSQSQILNKRWVKIINEGISKYFSKI